MPIDSSTVSAAVATDRVAVVLPEAIVTVFAPSFAAVTKSPPPVSDTFTVTSRLLLGAALAVTVKVAAVPSVTTAPASMVTVGPVTDAFTTMSNSSLTESVLSLAVTFTVSVPTFAACGVPVKVRVAAVNVNQVGSAVPSDCVAV